MNDTRVKFENKDIKIKPNGANTTPIQCLLNGHMKPMWFGALL